MVLLLGKLFFFYLRATRHALFACQIKSKQCFFYPGKKPTTSFTSALLALWPTCLFSPGSTTISHYLYWEKTYLECSQVFLNFEKIWKYYRCWNGAFWWNIEAKLICFDGHFYPYFLPFLMTSRFLGIIWDCTVSLHNKPTSEAECRPVVFVWLGWLPPADPGGPYLQIDHLPDCGVCMSGVAFFPNQKVVVGPRMHAKACLVHSLSAWRLWPASCCVGTCEIVTEEILIVQKTSYGHEKLRSQTTPPTHRLHHLITDYTT